MKILPITLPITIVAPQIHLINAGLLTCLFRPLGGTLDRLQAGDCLWVREPFVLPKDFDHFSPTAAAGLIAGPLFTTGAITGHLQPGRPRFARELLRAWHRQHLRVTRIERRRLQAITPGEIQAQGYALAESFAEAWDRNLSLTKASAQRWSENPHALAIHFDRVAAPVDAQLGEAA